MLNLISDRNENVPKDVNAIWVKISLNLRTDDSSGNIKFKKMYQYMLSQTLF